jgi:ATP-dependent RNA helicase DDX5/DBP2
MGWNTALDANGTTYYWNEHGASQYERPPDFDEATAQSAGSYTQYEAYYQTWNDYAHLGMQYSRPTNTNYKDVQDGEADRPADDSVAEYWKKNDVKVYGGSPPPFLTFEAANLPPQIMGAIAQAGYVTPSVIQAQTWPAAMAKRDVIGVAKTGSGKTLGFLMPGFLTAINLRANPQLGPTILVLAPTRELAMQIDVEAQKFGVPIGIRSVCCYGGAPKGSQLMHIRQGCHCVIGTPGRLNDFREANQIQLNQVMYLVMDEADRMLDMGFEPQIRKIVNGGIRPDRQTLFYTATWPKAVRGLAYEFLRSPVQVEVGDINSLNANKDITQYVHFIRSQADKGELMQRIFGSLEMSSRVIIFTSTKRMADQLGQQLSRFIGVAVIHGDKDQREREAVLGDFKSGRRPVMIATDVAARGIDVKDVKAVINYDFPSNIEDYVHRIGRTGRAGQKGISHTFMDGGGKDGKYARALADIMKKSGQKLPAELARAANIRLPPNEILDQSVALQPVPGGGMLNPENMQAAMAIPSVQSSAPEGGDFKRGVCTRGSRCGGFGGGGYAGAGGGFGGGFGGGGYGGAPGGYGAPPGGGYGAPPGGGYGGGGYGAPPPAVGGGYGAPPGGGYGNGAGGYGAPAAGGRRDSPPRGRR